jgi:hypothetical protein
MCQDNDVVFKFPEEKVNILSIEADPEDNFFLTLKIKLTLLQRRRQLRIFYTTEIYRHDERRP